MLTMTPEAPPQVHDSQWSPELRPWLRGRAVLVEADTDSTLYNRGEYRTGIGELVEGLKSHCETLFHCNDCVTEEAARLRETLLGHRPGAN
jgi:hypothetical protein